MADTPFDVYMTNHCNNCHINECVGRTGATREEREDKVYKCAFMRKFNAQTQ